MSTMSTSIRQIIVIAAVLAAAALPCSAQSARSGYGSIPYADAGGTGVMFRVWAPNASSVQVLGDFNGWQYGTYLISEGVGGDLSLDINGASAGQQYKYVINGNLWRKDPRARRNDGNNSVVYDRNAFDWESESYTPPDKKDLVIYELHLGSFYDPEPGDWHVATFEDAINKLDYLADMGINCIELMPVAEFPGDRSWGYNPIDLFAVEGTYGGADQFKSFVKACHQRGIAVYLDIVHNHYDAQNPDCDLWEFDGWNGGPPNYGGIYFYQEDGKCCTIWGRRPNYGRTPVQDFISDNIVMWLDEYHVDGFRWDSPMNIKYYDGNFNSDGYNLVWNLNQYMKNNYTNHFSVGEDQNQDMNFDSEWHDSFHWNIVDQLTKANDVDRNMYTVRDHVAGAGGLYRVIYTESHDKVGKLNNDKRLVTKIDPADPASYWARKRAGLGAALTLTSPGIPMLFMGQEWFESEAFDDYDPLDWDKADSEMRARLMFKHLVRMRRDLDGGTAGLKGTGIDVHHVNNSAKVIAFHRWDSHGTGDDVVVAANFSATRYGTYDIAFPYAGTWYAHFNSDWMLYDTNYNNYGVAQVSVASDWGTATIDLGPYSVVVFSRTAAPSRDSDGDAMLDSWETSNSLNAASAADAQLDPDNDGLTNIREFELQTDPQQFSALTSYDQMALAGNLNNWDWNFNPMSLTSHYTWATVRLVTSSDLQFKFVADHDWATSWGDADQSTLELPFSGFGDQGGAETPIQATNSLTSNTVYFSYLETDQSYHAEILPNVDADSDGMNDGWEVFFGFATNDAGDATGDPDGDNFTNLQEFRNGSHPRIATEFLHDYETMHLAGDFNNWSRSRATMKLFENYGWQTIVNMENESEGDFKFVGNGSWSYNWGDDSQSSTNIPIDEYGDWQGGNITAATPLNGVYRLRFNQKTVGYQVELLAALDADGDGIHDSWEELFGFDSSDASDASDDPDHDGMSNLVEFEFGSDPLTADYKRTDYSGMNWAGTFNEWNVTNTPMDLVDHFTWRKVISFTNTGDTFFKFAAEGQWTESWGDNDSPTNLPLTSVADAGGANAPVRIDRTGDHRFTFNEQTLQYTVEFVPQSSYGMLNLPGSFNGWDPTAYPMQLVDNHTWELQFTVHGESNASFKFVADHDWDSNWGETNQPATDLPLFGDSESFGENIGLTETLSGKYRMRFNDDTKDYSLIALSETDTDEDGIPDRWELLYGLNPTNASDADAHDDADGMTNLDEYRADTDPTSTDSVLLILDCDPVPGGIALQWQGGEDCWQYLMAASPDDLSDWRTIMTNPPPAAESVAFTNLTTTNSLWFRIKASRTPPD